MIGAPVDDRAAAGPDDATLSRLPHRDGYVPISDYALIGDTLTAALIARDGSLDWLCLPDFDGPAWFSGMLDRHRGGRCFVGPNGPAETRRAYLDGTPILTTTHRTEGGAFTVTDLMPLAHGGRRRLHPARQVLRVIEAVEGTPEVAVLVQPRPGYGARTPRLHRAGSIGWTVADGRDWLLMQSDIPLRPVADGTVAGTARLAAGERRVLALSFSTGDPGVVPAMGAAIDGRLAETRDFWQRLAGEIDYDGPFAAELHRSLVTLRLLTFSHSGAVVAAPTLGLPEVIGGVRNYDYRYCWLRDAAFVLHAFLELDRTVEGEGFFRWLMHATRISAPDLSCFYTLYGRTHAPTRPLHTVEGWRGSAPVVLGNGANSQLQLDGYGAVLTSALVYIQHGGNLGVIERRRLTGFARRVLRDWTLPDNGLWEMPDPRRHHTYSKAMCWAALDSFIRLARCGAIPTRDLAPFEAGRDRIRAHVLRNAWSERRQAFTGALGQDWLDAAVLLLPRLGLVEAGDPRMQATYRAIQDELGDGPLLRRYSRGVDGLPGREGSFTVCGFWAADYLARAGRCDEAEARIEGLLAHASDLGLMSEETDPESGAQLGNFPQAFSHAGLVGAVCALNAARGLPMRGAPTQGRSQPGRSTEKEEDR